jgi:hypothetical protein
MRKKSGERMSGLIVANLVNSMVVKGHRRDTRWYSIIDDEWNDTVKSAFEAWLSEDNFDVQGQQIKRLEAFRMTG